MYPKLVVHSVQDTRAYQLEVELVHSHFVFSVQLHWLAVSEHILCFCANLLKHYKVRDLCSYVFIYPLFVIDISDGNYRNISVDIQLRSIK